MLWPRGQLTVTLKPWPMRSDPPRLRVERHNADEDSIFKREVGAWLELWHSKKCLKYMAQDDQARSNCVLRIRVMGSRSCLLTWGPIQLFVNPSSAFWRPCLGTRKPSNSNCRGQQSLRTEWCLLTPGTGRPVYTPGTFPRCVCH